MAGARKRRVGSGERGNSAGAIDRRDFVRRAGGTVAVLALGSCDGGVEPGQGANVEVRITGLQTAAAGSISVSLPDGSQPGAFNIALPDAVGGESLGTATNVITGTFRLTYNQPANHTIIGATFQDITLDPGDTVGVTFNVVGIGTLEVEITGFTPGASGGGSVAITLPSGAPSGSTVTIPPPTNTTALGSNAQHPVGAHRVTYTPPGGYDISGPSFVDVSVPFGGTVRATFAVTPSSSPGVLVFTSDWSLALGNTTNAVRMGTKWSSDANITPDRVTVIPSTGLGFPANMANVLAVRYEKSTNTNFSGVFKQDGWQLPAVGGVICFRLYFRMSIDGTHNVSHHPVQAAFQGGLCPYSTEWVMVKGPTFAFELATLKDGNCSPNTDCHRWVLVLQRNVTYRIEERYERTGTTTWRLHARVYDSTGALVFGDSNFVCNQFGHNLHTLANHGNIVTPDPNCLRHKMIVNQGGLGDRGADAPAENRIFYGGFAVSLSDWCGPYTPGE